MGCLPCYCCRFFHAGGLLWVHVLTRDNPNLSSFLCCVSGGFSALELDLRSSVADLLSWRWHVVSSLVQVLQRACGSRVAGDSFVIVVRQTTGSWSGRWFIHLSSCWRRPYGLGHASILIFTSFMYVTAHLYFSNVDIPPRVLRRPYL